MEDPILIVLHAGKGFVWDADDWLKLRRTYRIVGALVGCLANVPRQDSVSGLPMILLPEELRLILDKKIGVLLTITDHETTEVTKENYSLYHEAVQREQLEVYAKKREAEVRGMIERIVAGKKKKFGRGEGAVPVDEQSAYEEEMARTKDLEVGLYVQIPTGNPWLSEDKLVPAEWSHPNTPLDTLKCRVYRDLWERGLYLTSGTKFGGHFLAYPGEPLKFHAFYVVVVSLPTEPLSPLDLLRHSRLSTHTKKTFVLASTDSNDLLTYTSFEWTGKT